MRASLLVTSFVTAFVLASGPLWPTMAHAETCPDVPDDEVALRRSMAKEWFAKAEEAEAGGDRQAAIRRYACSLNLAPHPSTAYNLGTVAEKSGDLSMAVDGFRTYLKLATEATDRPAIEARIIALEAKISELRKDIAPKAALQPTVATPPAVPPLGAAGAAPVAAADAARPAAPSNAGASAHRRHTAGWITGAGAVGALGAGLALNVMARSKMTTCFSQYGAGVPGALDRCDEAKPLAYGSYVLFAAAGVAGAVGAALLLWTPEAAAPEQPEVALAPALVPGGAGLVASGRF